MIRDFEKERQSLLRFLNNFREDVESAIEIQGEYKIEKPSVKVSFNTIQPDGFVGTGHTRYSCTIDLLDPHSLTSKVKT